MALTATLIADFSSFISATKDAGAAMSGFKEQTADVGQAATGFTDAQRDQAVAVAGQVRKVAGEVFEMGKGFIKAYTEGQDASNKLTSALQATGQATPAVIAQYQAMADEFQKTSRYGDEAITTIQASLTTIGKVAPAQMQLAVTATTGLATALQIDLNAAAKMVSVSLDNLTHEKGPVKKLAQYLGDAYKPGMSAAEMLQAIADKTSGANARDLQTYNGMLENMNNRMGEASEQGGEKLVGVLGKLSEWFAKLPTGVQDFGLAVVGLGPQISTLLSALSSLVTVIGAVGLGAAAAIAIGALAGIGAGVATAILYWHKAGDQAKELIAIIKSAFGQIPEIAKQAYEGFKRWMVDGLNQLVALIRLPIDQIIYLFRLLQQTIVGGSIVPDMMRGIADEFRQLDAIMVDPARDAARQASRAFAGMTSPAVGGFGGLTAGGAAGGGTVINISMTGMLGANDPQTRAAITQVVGDALAQSMRGQRLLSSA